MTKKDWAKIGSATLVSVFLGMIVLAVVVYSKRKKKLSVKKLFSIINDDIEYWNGINETSQKGAEKLKEWWSWIGQNFSINQLKSSTFQSSHYWSAVYISSIMKRWGAGDGFKYSARHSDYICEGIKASQDKDKGKVFWSYRPDEASVNVGDIIAIKREDWVTYDNLCSGAPTHTDIVYRIEKTDYGYNAIVSGGNLSNTRKSSFVKLDKNKKIQNPSSFLAIMKNQRT